MKLPDNNGFFKGCVLILIMFYPLFCMAQDAPFPLAYRSNMLGYGISSAYDSYLSPLKYKGYNFGVLFEQMKNTGLMNGNISTQHFLNANYSKSENKSGTASYHNGFLKYNYGLFHRFNPVEKLQIFAGMQAGGLLGFVYSTRNGNNPATGKAHIDLSLSTIANYSLKLRSQPVNLRYQFSLPFIGAMYSPSYGQSYYEIGLGVTDNLIHLSSLHNYISVYNMLSAEIPFKKFTLRISYINSLYETRINDLDTQVINNTYYIGLSHNFFVIHGKQKKDNYRYVF